MHSITWEPNGVYLKLSGVISINEVIQSILKIGSHPEFDSLFYRITDYSEIIEPIPEEIDQIIAFNVVQNYSNQWLLDASVTQDPVVIQLLHHHKSRHPLPNKMELFLSLDNARQWLLNNNLI